MGDVPKISQSLLDELVKTKEANMTPSEQVATRVKALEIGIQLAHAKGAPGHAVYIAADLYAFLLTGQRPEWQKRGEEVVEPKPRTAQATSGIIKRPRGRPRKHPQAMEH